MALHGKSNEAAVAVAKEARVFYERNARLFGRGDAELLMGIIFFEGGILDCHDAEIARRLNGADAPAKKATRERVAGMRTVKFTQSTMGSAGMIEGLSRIGAFAKNERASFSAEICRQLVSKGIATYCDGMPDDAPTPAPEAKAV
jgi:hypothetical protein